MLPLSSKDLWEGSVLFSLLFLKKKQNQLAHELGSSYPFEDFSTLRSKGLWSKSCKYQGRKTVEISGFKAFAVLPFAVYAVLRKTYLFYLPLEYFQYPFSVI